MRAARGSDGDALARLAAPRLQARAARRGARGRGRRRDPRPRSQLDDGAAYRQPVRPDRRRSSRCSSCARAGPSAGARAAGWPSACGCARRRARGPRERWHHLPPQRPPGRRACSRRAGRGCPRRLAGLDRRSGSSTWSGARPTSRSASSSRPCRRSSARAPASASPARRCSRSSPCAAARGVLRPTRAQLLSCLAVGTLLMGANAVVSVAEVEVPSSMAALLIASVPLWVILYRRALGDRVAARSVAAVLVGFAGVALLLLPGRADRRRAAARRCSRASARPRCGPAARSPRRAWRCPRDPFVSGGWQMLLGGGVCVLTGALVGEFGDFAPRRVQPRGRSSRSPTSSCSGPGSRSPPTPGCCRTRRSPGSPPTPTSTRSWRSRSAGRSSTRPSRATTFAGAAIIVASVAAVVRTESRRSNAR